jgi:hypothetical protein
MLGRLKDYLLRAKIMFSRELPALPNTVVGSSVRVGA